MSDHEPKRGRWGRWLGAAALAGVLLAGALDLAHLRRVAADLATTLAWLDEADPHWRLVPPYVKITGSARRAGCAVAAMRTLIAVERFRLKTKNSIGDDRTDDGGDPVKDIGSRLRDVDKRRAPP